MNKAKEGLYDDSKGMNYKNLLDTFMSEISLKKRILIDFVKI